MCGALLSLCCTLLEFPGPVWCQVQSGLRAGGRTVDGKLVAATVLFPTFLSHAALPGALLRGRQPWAGGSACHLCGPRSGRDELAGYCGLGPTGKSAFGSGGGISTLETCVWCLGLPDSLWFTKRGRALKRLNSGPGLPPTGGGGVASQESALALGLNHDSAPAW